MPHKRSPKKIEERKAKKYAFQHSIIRHRNNALDEMTERIYIGTPDELQGAVLAECKEAREGTVPEIPQGLVIGDSRGEGFFDSW